MVELPTNNVPFGRNVAKSTISAELPHKFWGSTSSLLHDTDTLIKNDKDKNDNNIFFIAKNLWIKVKLVSKNNTKTHL